MGERYVPASSGRSLRLAGRFVWPVALSLLILGLLPVSPAHAAHWAVTYQAAGTTTNQGQSAVNWPAAPTPDANGNISLWTNQYMGVSSSGTITPVLTWTKDGEPTLPPAPAQISVLVILTCDAAGATAAASDGFNDTFPGQGTQACLGTFTHLVQQSNAGLLTTVKLPPVSVSASDTCTYPMGPASHANITFRTQIFTASLQAHSTVDNANWDPVKPAFFSGTNCSASAVCPAVSGYVKQVQLTVGGILTKEYDDTSSPPANKNPNVIYSSGTSQASVTLAINFDSTNFTDGNSLSVQMLVTDSNSNQYPATVKANIYNEGYAGGGTNTQVPGSGDFGTPASQNVGNGYYYSHIKSTLGPHDTRSATLSATPGYSHYFVYSNGEDRPSTSPKQPIYFEATAGGGNLNFVFGLAANDNSGNSTKDGVDNWVAKKTSFQPSYNFVFLDVCNSLYFGDFATGFGIGASQQTGTDRAVLGWTTTVENSAANADWVNVLYQALENGYTLKQSLKMANQADTLLQGGGSSSPNSPAIYGYDGDILMTLHNVYLGSSTQTQSTTWFR